MIDWSVAIKTARTVVPPGPQVTAAEARQVATELVSMVPTAERVVAELTGMIPPDLHVPVAVVDRAGWVQANIDGFRIALEPLIDKITARRAASSPSGIVHAVGSRVTGVQIGLLMAYLSSRVLGQFELFLPSGSTSGRLTLVAPNIVETERRLDVDPHDFRLWVTIHEVTHRTQFTAVPWLRGYFTDQVKEFLDAADLDPTEVLARLKSVAGAIRDAAAGRPVPSIVEVIQTPEQKVVLDRMQALMSLLEGHGDYVMDAVGPDVVPTGERIRERFDQRRKGAGPIDRAIRRLLGIDLKMQQYQRGAAFVRHVVGAVGMERFNAVWTSPSTLPTLPEITAPDDWIARVFPDGSAVAVGDGA